MRCGSHTSMVPFYICKMLLKIYGYLGNPVPTFVIFVTFCFQARLNFSIYFHTLLSYMSIDCEGKFWKILGKLIQNNI
jgi:hypothetical protein